MRGINHCGDSPLWRDVPRWQSGPSGNTTSTQTNTPWAGQQPYLLSGFQQAQTDFNTLWPQMYPPNNFAPLTDQQNAAIKQMTGYGAAGGTPALNAAGQSLADTLQSGTTLTSPAAGYAQSPLMAAMSPTGIAATAPAFGQGQNWLSNLMSGSTLNPWTSPGFSTIVGNTLASTIPAATAGFNAGGRMDSGLATRAASEGATSAVGQLANQYFQGQEQLASDAARQAAANTATQQQLQQSAIGQGMSDYLNQQNNLINAARTATGTDAATAAAMQTGLGAASLKQQENQNNLQDAINHWTYQQQLPWNMLQMYMNLVGGSGYGNSSALTQPYYSNVGANVMAGLGTAASLAAAGAAIA